MDLTQNKEWVTKAVKGLRTLIENSSTDNKVSLFSKAETDSHAKVKLDLSLIKIPKIPEDGKVQGITIRSPIPHNYIDKGTDILLITKDVRRYKKNYDASAHAFKDLLREQNAIGLVTDVMPLSQLRKEYPLVPNKRDLASQYDIVLCDDTVIRRVPQILGKHFYKAKKRPIQVNLKVANLRREIETKLSKSYLHMDLQGSSASTQIGRLNQSDVALAENIMAVVEDWRTKMPGGWDNVRSLHLKTELSKSVPLFMSLTLPSQIPAVPHPTVKPNVVVERGDFTLLEPEEQVEVTRSWDIKVVKRNEDSTATEGVEDKENIKKRRPRTRRQRKRSSQTMSTSTNSEDKGEVSSKPTTKKMKGTRRGKRSIEKLNERVARKKNGIAPKPTNNVKTNKNEDTQSSVPNTRSKRGKNVPVKLDSKAEVVVKKGRQPSPTLEGTSSKTKLNKKNLKLQPKTTDLNDGLKGVSQKSKSIKRNKSKAAKKIKGNGVLSIERLAKFNVSNIKKNLSPKPKKIKQ